jgi:PTS system sucrose-specific IIC component
MMPDAPVTAGTTQFVAPVQGQLEPLSAVQDDVFSTKMMGDGFAVEPAMGTIVAPVSGTIVSVMDTKHAWTMKSDTGLEIIVHLGLDTVELKGAPFDLSIRNGDHVQFGQQVGLMDLDAIKAAGKGTTVITIITNMAAVANITPVTPQGIEAGAPTITVTTK